MPGFLPAASGAQSAWGSGVSRSTDDGTTWQQLTAGLLTNRAYNDVLGEQITLVVDGEMAAGYHSASFDASRSPSGVYICTMQVGSFMESRKLLLVR